MGIWIVSINIEYFQKGKLIMKLRNTILTILAILMLAMPFVFIKTITSKTPMKSNDDSIKVTEGTSTVELTTITNTTPTKVTTKKVTTTRKTTTAKETSTTCDTTVTTFGTSPVTVPEETTVVETLPSPVVVELPPETTNETTTIVETAVTELKDETTTEVIKETEAAVTTTTQQPEEYVVFKPSTHYIHRNTCHWFNDECIRIENTEGIECRRCSECHPDMEIITEYIEPTPTANSGQSQLGSDGQYHSALAYVTEEERIMLCNLVALEGGSNWISTYDKACIVCTVMNRYHDGGWSGGRANTIYNIITAPYQYAGGAGVSYYISNVNQGCIDAVDYYFDHQSDFPHYTSFWGDGSQNHFR